MKQLLSENLEFLRQFRRRFHTTGAVLPSSRFLAHALTRPLVALKGPKRVLEVGPGTGAVTRSIVTRIGEQDWFDLVEINDRFAELLRQRFMSDPRFRTAAASSVVHCCALQEFRTDAQYDAIVSGLPFNNFKVELVAELLSTCFQLLAPGGTLSFFEYMYVRPIKQRLAHGAERARLLEIEKLLQTQFAQYRFRQDWVFVNVPPAWVQHLRKPVDATGGE